MKHGYLTDLPACIRHVGSVSIGGAQRGRWPLTMDELSGWCGGGAYGVCVAFAVDGAPHDAAWLAHAALWLASLRSQPDDALWLDDGKLYFVRRYDCDVDAAVLRVGIEQQGAVARWLSAHHEAARGMRHAGPCE